LALGFAAVSEALAQEPDLKAVKSPSPEWPAPSDRGAAALAIKPAKWMNAETEHFILHYRRLTEARKVAREAEFHFRFVAETLGRDPAAATGRSRIYLFEDEDEWRGFLRAAEQEDWVASFAYGPELFLNVRRSGSGDKKFRVGLLAHELSHAVVARFYPRSRWPLWLNEGLAEHMAAASVAARKNQSVGRHLDPLPHATWTVEQLEARATYPADPVGRVAFYQSSERVVRFLFRGLPPERFTAFLDAILAGKEFAAALTSTYGDEIGSMDEFQKRYMKFER
jgi:hypothetical protein